MLIALLQRYYLWFYIVLSGLCGLALGTLGATSIGLLADAGIETGAQVVKSTRKTVPRLRISDYQSILEGNIFNSAAQTQSFTPTRSTQTTAETPPPEATDWVLIGTVSGGETPLASLKNGAEVKTYQLQQELPDGARLTRVERNRVELTYPDGRTVQVSIEPDKNIPGRRFAAERSAKSRSNNNPQARTVPPVEEIGEKSWLIPEQTADNARTNIGNLLRQARAVPFLENGKTTGFEIQMIRAGSLIAELGLQKGDILREVNGLPLDSPEKALQIFGQLRQAKQISISLERRGKAMTFAYEIR